MINQTINILIIDDDQIDRAISFRILNRSNEANFQIHEAESAEAALEKMKTISVDCILIDYQLPGSNGIEIIGKIKKFGIKYIPIIMLTGQGSEDVAVHAMKAGVTDYISKNQIDPNLLVKTIINAIKNEKLKKTIDEQKQKIKYFSYYDTLTGLLNRHTFEEILHHSIRDSEKLHHSLVVILIDIDNFMAINDSIGHLAGNAILIETGKRLSAEFSNDVLISRYGEDEFAILWKDERIDLSQIHEVTNAICNSINKPYEIGNHEPISSVTASAGVAIFPRMGKSAAELLQAASSALAKAKELGGGKIIISE